MNRRLMDEHVVCAIIRDYEAKSFLYIEPFDGSGRGAIRKTPDTERGVNSKSVNSREAADRDTGNGLKDRSKHICFFWLYF